MGCFRLVVRGVSPVIVRTLAVPASVSLRVLHEALLVVFDWSGECLHEFVIRGVGYSSDWLVGGIDTRTTNLGMLGLRPGERLVWRCDFLADWVIDLRVEAVTSDDDDGAGCASGRRAGPPGWSRGVAEFFWWEDAHSLGEVFDCVDELRRVSISLVNRRLTALEVDSCDSSCKSG